jgi:hypothetical protein
LGQGFSGQFLATKGISTLVFAFLEAGEEIDAVACVVWVIEAVLDACDGDAGEVLDRLDAVAEEPIG